MFQICVRNKIKAEPKSLRRHENLAGFRGLSHNGFIKEKEKNVALILTLGTRTYYEIIEVKTMKLIEKHRQLISWYQKKLGLSDYGLLWLVFFKGVFVSLVIERFIVHCFFDQDA